MAMPPDDDTEAERELAAQANAMKDQLRKDIASWSKARHDGGAGIPEGPAAPAAKQTAVKPAVRKAAPAPAAAKPAAASGKPFRMSYSGSSTTDYIKYMRDRGAK